MPCPIETQRLLLQPLETADAAFILELLNTEGWLSFIGDRNVHSLQAASDYIERVIANEALTYWVVRLKETGRPAGIITLIKREYLETIDIGFAFLPGFTKAGYAFEATGAVLRELKQYHPVVLAITVPQNLRSIRLLGKLGFVFLKEIQPGAEILHVYSINTDLT